MFLLGVDQDYQVETEGIQKQAAKKKAKAEKEAAKKAAKVQNQIHLSTQSIVGEPGAKWTEDYQPGGKEQQDMEKEATEDRQSMNLQDHQASMIACAWTLNSDVKIFRQFHLVVCIDGLEDTNNECQPELTLSVKDTEGKWHVILCALLPNQKAWVF